jgi:peroxiredoxin
MKLLIAAIVLALVVTAIARYVRRPKASRRSPAVLQRGEPLPDFTALDEHGKPVRSSDLRGTAAVILFVRGNWCPFCSAQVEALTSHYKSIVDLGGRLILVTPKPLETTRRVAEFFEVEFDFWLDENLAIARQLDLLDEGGVPEDYNQEYGSDTVWPVAVVIDRAGKITFVERSKDRSDRPDPQVLLRELKKAISN